MDVVTQRRLVAHAKSAAAHERRAEFHRAVSDFFTTLGDDAQASRARQLADDYISRATRERLYQGAR